MTRLTGLLNDTRGMVDLELAFRRAEDGTTCISGRYETNLQLVCQRCLEPFAVNLANTINVAITFEGAVLDKLPVSLEPLALKQETMLLSEFIEDEILLGLPIAPMHRLEDCTAGESGRKHNPVEANPFHILKELKSG